MTRAIGKDSLTKCEQPSMLYDAIRYPSAPSIQSKPHIDSADSSRDTLESTQQRLNREMLEKFQNTSSRLSHSSYIAVSQTGKYLFLAIMLPPYLCCYGIPKWLMTTLVPQVFSMTKTQGLRVGHFFTELAARVTDLMKGVIEQMLGDALRSSKRHAKAFKEFVKNFARKQLLRLKKLKETVSGFHSDIHRGIYKGFIKARDALRKWLERRALQVIEKIVNKIKRVLAIIFYPLDVCDRYLLTPVINWFKAKAQLVFGWTKGIVKQVIEKAIYVKSKVAQKLQPFINFLRLCYRISAIHIKKWASVCWQKLIPIGQWMYKIASVITGYISHRFLVFGKKLQPPLRWVKQKLSTMAKKSLFWMKTAVNQALNKFKQWIVSPWQSLKLLLADRRAKKRARKAKIYGAILGVFKWFSRGISKGIKGFFVGGVNFIKALWTMLIWWLKGILAFPARCVAFCVIFYRIIMTSLQKGVYAIRLMLAWSIAFCRVGMIHVREFTAFLQ